MAQHRGFTFEQVAHLVQHETYVTSPLIKPFPSADTLTVDLARELIDLREMCARAVMASGERRVQNACLLVRRRSARYRQALDEQERGRQNWGRNLALNGGTDRAAFLDMFSKQQGDIYDMSWVSRRSEV